MSAGRVSRIQRRYEENIRQSNSRSYNASPNASRGQQSSVRTQQENFRQGQQPQNTWGDSVRSGFTTLREARPVQGLTNFVAESIPKVANTAWTKCGADTTWEEFDFGTNPFKGGNNFFKQGEDFTGDIISDDDSIVERDPFNFPIKPNQPSSRRKEEVPTGWASFQTPHFEVQAVRYNSNPSATKKMMDDTFFDQGDNMFDIKAVPIAAVIPIDNVEPVLQTQMTDPDDYMEGEEGDEEELVNNPKTTKSSRFRPFGGKSKVEVTVGLPSLKVKKAVDSTQKQNRKEEERLRKKEEQRLKELREEKEREEQRIRRKEELLRKEEERLAREQERILQEEERMMREEEERERRREERRLRELEIERLKEERKQRQLRKREELDFDRIQQKREKKKSDEGGILDWEDIEQPDSFESVEVDWQGFPPEFAPPPPPPPRRRESRKRERAPRAPREPREPIKIGCPSCSCPSCPTFDCTSCFDCCRDNKKFFIILLVVLLLAGTGVGIYFGVTSSGALDGDDDYFVESNNPDCQAVLGGFAIPNEQFYPTVRLSWVMDISADVKWPSMPALTSAVRDQFQEMAIPVLAGCMGNSRDDGIFDSQYDILNGSVRSVRDVGSCRVGEPQPCARVLVDFVVYVRGESSVLDLISHISAQYNFAVTAAMEQMDNVRQLGLVGLFEQRA